MPQWQPPRMRQIHNKLRDDFRRELTENYDYTDLESDPILEVLFRSLAVQIEELYDRAAKSIPLAVLNELMAGLDLPVRWARPAQTVMKFSMDDHHTLLEEGAELIGEAKSREKFIFALDTPICISSAQLSMVAVYQKGELRLHHGMELPKEIEAARPAFEPVAADLGRSPAIFMAIDVPDSKHLSYHGFYFDLDPEAKHLLTGLQRDIWCVLDEAGEESVEGMLRSRSGNGGVRKLEWLVTESGFEKDERPNFLPEGLYGGRVFIFPDIPPERRYLTKTPPKLAKPISQLFQTGGSELFDRQRAWIKIALPQQTGPVTEALDRIVMHCTTASNVEILNQTINFDSTGTVIPINKLREQISYLIRPISIKGEHGTDYQDESKLSFKEKDGRYRYQRGRLEIKPAITAHGDKDRYVTVRLLLSNGKLDAENRVGTGGITTFLNRTPPKGLEFRNLNIVAGGTDEGTHGDTQEMFAKLLLSRERVLTLADLEAAVKLYEPKVRKVCSEPSLRRTPDGLRRVQLVTITLDRNSFTAPDLEAQILQNELQIHLQEHAMLGLEVETTIEWM